MIITVDYNPLHNTANITSNIPDGYAWSQICTIARSDCSTAVVLGVTLIIPWYKFLSFKTRLLHLTQYAYPANIILSDAAKDKLNRDKKVSYTEAIQIPKINGDQLKARLLSVGFVRPLSDNQIRNVCKLASLPAGATFSVPGAGKTTEALAYYFYNASPDDRLLIVAPKNALEAWNEQLSECLANPAAHFTRLRGGARKITTLLADKPQFIIISYQQFIRVQDIIKDYICEKRTFMFLDESHRIKSGSQGIAAEAIVSVSDIPYRKLVMSGTPMPQAIEDLLPQFNFLYPDVTVDISDIIDRFQNVFVRTTKAELGLPEVNRVRVPLRLGPKQEIFYNLLRSATARDAAGMSRNNKAFMRSLGKSIIKIMQYVSNPALLVKDINFMFDSRLSDAIMEENSTKIDKACEMAREFAIRGYKTIIWTSFVENVETIALRLSNIGADFIHGGVDAGDETEEDTREWKIKEFKNNPSKWVLVANPAAASEGISLHMVCHHAIYVDRTFNAAHFLQSEDRIHRYGLTPGTQTNIYVLECSNTIDEIINDRLINKVELMSRALNDPSLSILADISSTEESNEYGGIDQSDVDAIMQYLGGGQYD